jgi:hypothetical protein
LLEGGHIIGKRQQQRLIAAPLGEDLPDMRVDGLGELNLEGVSDLLISYQTDTPNS